MRLRAGGGRRFANAQSRRTSELGRFRLYNLQPGDYIVSATVGSVKAQLRRQAVAALAMDRDDMAFDSGQIRQCHPSLPCTTVAEVLARERTAC